MNGVAMRSECVVQLSCSMVVHIQLQPVFCFFCFFLSYHTLTHSLGSTHQWLLQRVIRFHFLLLSTSFGRHKWTVYAITRRGNESYSRFRLLFISFLFTPFTLWIRQIGFHSILNVSLIEFFHSILPQHQFQNCAISLFILFPTQRKVKNENKNGYSAKRDWSRYDWVQSISTRTRTNIVFAVVSVGCHRTMSDERIQNV